jgi:hypothetical protein
MNDKDQEHMNRTAYVGRNVVRNSDNMAGVIKKVYGHGVYQVLWFDETAPIVDRITFTLV